MTPSSLPSQDDALQMVQRLWDRDPTASADFARTWLAPLSNWLQQIYPRTSEDQRLDAAEDTILSLIKNPHQYNPDKSDLLPFLKMSARRDLENLLRKEQRHQHVPLQNSVEDSADDGKYLQIDDDPSFAMQLEETRNAQDDPVLKQIRLGLNEQERAVLDLMRGGERKTITYAAVLGIQDQSQTEQERQVKRIKDRIIKRIERARSSHDETT